MEPILPVASGRPAWRLRLLFVGLLARALGSFALGKIAQSLTPRRLLKNPQWDPLPGPHAVGVRDIDLCDHRRTEPETTGLARRILARVWYPAAAQSQDRRRFHTEDESAWLAEKDPRVLAGRIHALGPLETWSGSDAPPQGSDIRFPVLLFSHGLGGTVSQNTHLCERLASRGYIVVSLTHPYGGASVRFADGSEAIMTPAMSKQKFALSALRYPSLAVRSAKSWDALVEAGRALLALPGLKPELQAWMDDTSAVLDQLMAGATSPPIEEVLAHADFARVGAFGMSFGGATSAAAAHHDPRIGAAVNLDGNQFGTQLWDTTIRVPLLELRSEEALVGTGGTFNDLHYERFASAGASGTVWRYLVRGSKHADFTDLTLLGPRFLRRWIGHGPIEGSRMSALVLDLVGRFFDRHLKDDSTAWPADPMQSWPELRPIDTAALRQWALRRATGP